MIAENATCPEVYRVCIISIDHTHWGCVVRTNIVIDDTLMEQALTLSGLRTKREAVEEGLKLLIAQRKQAEIRKLRGRLHWEGDLDRMRSDR